MDALKQDKEAVVEQRGEPSAHDDAEAGSRIRAQSLSKALIRSQFSAPPVQKKALGPVQKQADPEEEEEEEEREEEEEPIQTLRRAEVQRSAADSGSEQDDTQSLAASGVAHAQHSLPHSDRIQASFGRHDVSGVKSAIGGPAAGANAALGAEAYATGNRIGFRGPPSLRTAAHEAAHVVQQRAGVHLKGGVGEIGDRHERHADAVADHVVKGQPAEALLDRYAGRASDGADSAAAGHGAVQRKGEAPATGTEKEDEKKDEKEKKRQARRKRRRRKNAKIRKKALHKVEDLLSYSTFDWVITDAEARSALALLAKLSVRNLRGVMRRLKHKFKSRLLDNLPDDVKGSPAYSKVLVAMGPSGVLRYIKSLLSYGIFDWAVTDADVKAVLEVVSALKPSQKKRLYDKLGPKLRKRLAEELPQETLGARGEYKEKKRDDSLAEGETRYSIWDELFTAIGSIPPGVMGEHQQSRVRPALDALTPAAYKSFRALVDQCSGFVERAFLFKALAANNPVGNISWFAGQIRGKDDEWLVDNCTLADARAAGGGIKQQYSHTCGVTTVQAIRGEYDPVYALKIRQTNSDIGAVDNKDPLKLNPVLAAEQKSKTETETGGVAGGHKGVAVSRSEAAKGSGRWVVDWLNDLSNITGLEYETKKDPSATDAIATLKTKVSAGMLTPTVIGNSAGAYTHYILCMQKRTKDNKEELQFHDPWAGVTVWKSESEIKNGIMDIAGSNMITALEVPKPATAKPAPGK